MLARVEGIISQFEQSPPPFTLETNAESLQFLRWVASKHFIFLGIREYDFVGGVNEGQLVPKPAMSLGLLRDPEVSVLRRGGEAMRLTPESRAFFLNSPPVIVSKANSKSTVHRRVHMDTIGIKVYGPDRQISAPRSMRATVLGNTEACSFAICGNSSSRNRRMSPNEPSP